MSELTQYIEVCVGEIFANKQAIGMSIGVSQGNDVLFSCGYGLVQKGKTLKPTAETVYRIGSLTKQITAVALLRLVDQGHLSLNDTVACWVPEAGEWGARVCIHDILSHTSGLPNTTSRLKTLIASLRRPGDEARACSMIFENPEFSPRSMWQYSNAGYLLAGNILERVTRTDLWEYLSADLFVPSHMMSTYAIDHIPPGVQVATGYDLQPEGGFAVAEYLNLATVGASGGLASTVTDLLRWHRMLQKTEVLSERSRQIWWEPIQLDDGMTVEYCLGGFIDSLGSYQEFAHRGDIPGASVFQAYYPAVDLNVVVLTNSQGAPAAKLGRKIARNFLGISQASFVQSKLSFRDRSLLSGAYRSGSTVIRMQDDGTDLMVHTPDGASSLGYDAAGHIVAINDPEMHFELIAHNGSLDILEIVGPALRFRGQRISR